MKKLTILSLILMGSRIFACPDISGQYTKCTGDRFLSQIQITQNLLDFTITPFDINGQLPSSLIIADGNMRQHQNGDLILDPSEPYYKASCNDSSLKIESVISDRSSQLVLTTTYSKTDGALFIYNEYVSTSPSGSVTKINTGSNCEL